MRQSESPLATGTHEASGNEEERAADPRQAPRGRSGNVARVAAEHVVREDLDEERGVVGVEDLADLGGRDVVGELAVVGQEQERDGKAARLIASPGHDHVGHGAGGFDNAASCQGMSVRSKS